MEEPTSKKPISTFKIVLLAVAALFSGIVSAEIIWRNFTPYELPLEFQEMPMSPSSEYMVRYKIAFHKMICGNYSIHFAICGALIGLACGAIGATKPSVPASSVAAVGGAVGGAICGYFGGMLLGHLTTLAMDVNWETVRYIGIPIDQFIQTTLMQCMVWIIIGTGIGLASTIPSGSVTRYRLGILGGVVGGLIAGIVYSLAAAIAFSSSNAVDFVPKYREEIFLWTTVCSLSIFVGLIYCLRQKQEPNLLPTEPA